MVGGGALDGGHHHLAAPAVHPQQPRGGAGAGACLAVLEPQALTANPVQAVTYSAFLTWLLNKLVALNAPGGLGTPTSHALCGSPSYSTPAEVKLNGHSSEEKEAKGGTVDLLSLDPLADGSAATNGGPAAIDTAAATASQPEALPADSHEQTVSLVAELVRAGGCCPPTGLVFAHAHRLQRALFSDPLNPLHPKAQKKVRWAC